MSDKKVESGNKIKVEYTGTLEDGTVFDSSENQGKPLEFTVGSGQLIKGFDEGVVGMAVGEEKEITLTPDQAYGQPNKELEKKIPVSQLPPEPKPQVGMTLVVSSPTGQQFPAKIIDVNETEVTIDLNHPLAGKTLKFKIKVVGISEGSSSDNSDAKPEGNEEKKENSEEKKE